ncbi:phosphocholine cytidylyltransferase family protein [Candidatus Saccharibacteria bacterium]|nr:phosphocholine cytidylyltransferase family protein [Candidatus Saccharibacteria bacterium]
MTESQFDQLTQNLFLHPNDKTTLEALEPYRAKRAIFLAAGFGSRLLPLTRRLPKPMIKVHGTRIIDTSINACLQAGIKEIYIVRGHLAGQFDALLKKYPMIKFIDNPDYDKANNISSAVVASHLLENAYVFEADLLIKNPKIITLYHYQSDVLGIWMEHSEDWVLVPDSNGYVAEEKVTGDRCYQMVGIYYWTKPDAERLRTHLVEAFNLPEGRSMYWETIPNQLHRGEYKIKIRPCLLSDVIEIDTFNELKAIDPSYR